jgi:hypothetical protein
MFNGELATVSIPELSMTQLPNTAMQTVFENGESLNETTFDEVRARVRTL